MAITTLISRSCEVLSAHRRRWVALAAVALLAAISSTAHAQTYTVSVSNDDGTGGTMNTLSWAILQANNNTGGTINVTVDTTLSGSLLALDNTGTTTISGNNHIIDAGGNQVFTVAAGTASISNFGIENAVARGGDGATGNGGGGGGLGAGGALYVGDNANTAVNVSISNITFVSNQAVGGAGGTGDGSSTNGGNGGGYDANANSPTAGTGGGAGGTTGDGGASGYGGGGGGAGSTGTTGGAGNGGGDGGGPGVGGNGGLALGGAVFVANGASLTITNSTVIDSSNSVTGGTGGTGSTTDGTAGTGSGSGLYVGIGSTATIDNSGANVTISGNIYSNGLINVSGTGASTVYFLGIATNSNLSSGTNVQSGTLSGTTNSLNSTITDSGNITFNQNFDGAFNGSINGAGSVTITSSGTVTFAQANTYTGGTTINAGTLQGTTTTVPGSVIDNGNLTINQNFDGTVTGTISGTGSVTVTSSGTVTLTQTNSYTGGTTLSAGTLQGTTNSVQGNVTNNSNVNFNQGFNGTYNGSMNGTGHVTLTGTGMVIFAQANSYSGGTTINAGTLQGNTNGIQGAIVDNSGLVFNQSFNGTYAGNVTGSGTLDLIGTGTVFTTGNIANTGPTTVHSGTYSVNGSTSSAITVSQSATIAGTGVINNNVTNYGNISAGNSSIGTLTINGNYAAQTTSAFIVDINNSGTTPGVNNDLVQVNGDVALGDGQVQVHGGTSIYTAGSRYNFLQYTGTRNGTFSSITDDMPFYDTTLVYGANFVAFDIFRSSTAYAGIAQNFNQYNVANYLDQHATTATGAFSNFLDQINSQTTAGAQSAFQQLEGEVNATAAQLMVQDTVYMYLLLRRGANGGQFGSAPPVFRDTADEYALAPAHGEDDVILVNTRASSATASDEKVPAVVAQTRQRLFRRVQRRPTYWTGWTTGYGIGGDAFTQGNAGNATYGFGGSLVALDHTLNEVTKVGIFGAYNHLELKVANPSQFNQANDGQFGTYLRMADEVKHFLFAGSVGFDSYSTRRSINVGTFSNSALANYSGWQASSYGEFGVTKSGWFTDWQPFVGMQYIYVRQNAFTETGADPVNLQVAGTNTNALRNLLGTRASWSCYTDRLGRIAPELRAVWLHEYLNPETTLNANFAGVGGANFKTQGLNFGRDWAVLGGGINMFVNDCTSIAINYDLQVNAIQAFHVGSGTYTRRW